MTKWKNSAGHNEQGILHTSKQKLSQYFVIPRKKIRKIKQQGRFHVVFVNIENVEHNTCVK